MNLKQRIRSKQLTIGSWLTIPSAQVVEILATAGFDWLAIDIEHSAIDVQTTQQLIRTIQGCGLQALVRVNANEETIIKIVLDSGADGVIVPMINSAEDARRMIDYVYYPPKGKRGVGLNRAQQYGTGFNEYLEKLKNDIIVIAQIEHVRAIENLETILQTDEIDATIIGPYDLSASMHKPGLYEDKEVKETINRYDAVCDKLNKPKGSHVISSSYLKLKEKIDCGYTFLAFSIDFFFLGDKAREEMKKLKL